MSIDELKALLDEGKITKEQFAAMAKAIDPNYTEEDPDQPPAPESDPEPTPEPDYEKMLQRERDRLNNKWGNDMKKLRQQFEAFKKNHLTEAQAAELERQQREDDLAERERALQEKENRLYAIKALGAAQLYDGSERANRLVDFVLAGSEAEIDVRVKTFGTLLKEYVSAEVDKRFKQHGRNPEQGAGAGEKNPYAKDTFNITQQMMLENTNPELAKQLRAAAGVR